MIFVFILQINNLASAQSYLWAKGAGGGEMDFGSSIITDVAGNIIVTGYFESPSITFGTTTLINADPLHSSDVFIVKYDASGNVLWAKSAGGFKNDYGTSLTTDASGNVIVTGFFFSSTITFGTTTLTNAFSINSSDIYVVKYDAAGNVLWAKREGGMNEENGSYVATDTGGNIILSGYFESSSIVFGTDTLTNVNPASTTDVFTVKYDGIGNVIWAKSGGSIDEDEGRSVSTDLAGNTIITGNFKGDSIIFESSSLANTNAASKDIFLVKYDRNGNVLWSKGAGGFDNDYSNSTTIDVYGNVILTGYFESDSIAFDSTYLVNTNTSGAADIFIAKFDSSGNLLWLKREGGTNTDAAFGICTDHSGNIIATGFFWSSTISFGATTLTNTSSLGSADIFCVKYDATGNVIWAKSAGGVDEDYSLSVTTDVNGDIIATGAFAYDSLTCANTTLLNAGSFDFFIFKLSGVSGISEINSHLRVKIYPNPTTGKFQLETKDGFNAEQIVVYSLDGQKVYSQMLNTNHEIINVQLASGIYFIKVIDGEKSSTQKLVVY